MASVLAKVDAPTYAGICALLCPYCAVKIPSTHSNAVPPEWTHAIPGTSQKFNCQAIPIRNARLSDGAADA